MRYSSFHLKGIFLLGAYLCTIALMFVAKGEATWLRPVAQTLALPILILFFYLNTAIDSKFEKNIFYGIMLFAISVPILMAQSILGHASTQLALAVWIIGYFSYARALISITSISNSLLYKHKWLAGVILGLGLIGLYFFITSIYSSGFDIIPYTCLGLACLVYFMAAINLWGQITPLLTFLFLIGAILLILYNSFLGLNISSNISIFDTGTSLFFYFGQLLMIIGAVRASLVFTKNDFSGISSILNKNKKS